jgi:hypothetical protein
MSEGQFSGTVAEPAARWEWLPAVAAIFHCDEYDHRALLLTRAAKARHCVATDASLASPALPP